MIFRTTSFGNFIRENFLGFLLVVFYSFLFTSFIYTFDIDKSDQKIYSLLLSVIFFFSTTLVLFYHQKIINFIQDKEFIIYLPFFLIIIIEFLKPYVAQHYITLLKGIVLGLIIFIGLIHTKKVPLYFIILMLVTSIWMLLNSLDSYSGKAVFEDGMRYLFPFLITLYSLAFIKNPKQLFKVLISFVIINDIFQIIIYLIYFIDIDTYYNLGLHYNNNQVFGIIRPPGITHSFGFFAFSNFISYFLLDKLNLFKNDKFLKIFFLLFVFVSLVYKYIFLTIIYFIIEKKWKNIVVLFSLSFVIFILKKDLIQSFYKGAKERIDLYIVEGNSMRTESLAFTYNYLTNQNPFYGEGIGTFGGPASRKYNSPFYKENNLNWFNNYNTTTTDNYYPHLFIENGMILGFLYLLSIFSIFLVNIKKLKKYWFLLFFMLFINFFNFSINTLMSQFYLFLIFIPLVYFKNKVSNE